MRKSRWIGGKGPQTRASELRGKYYGPEHVRLPTARLLLRVKPVRAEKTTTRIRHVHGVGGRDVPQEERLLGESCTEYRP